MKHFPLFFWMLLWLAACERPRPALKVPVTSHYDSLTLLQEYTKDTIITLIGPSNDSLTSPQQLVKQMAYLRAAAKRDLSMLHCAHGFLLEQFHISKLTPLGLKKYQQAFLRLQRAEKAIQVWLSQYHLPLGKPDEEWIHYMQVQKDLITYRRGEVQVALMLSKELLTPERSGKCEELKE